MSPARIANIEIESLDQFDAAIAGASHLRRWAVSSVDLSQRADALARVDVHGALFLGCAMTPELEDDLTLRGALVFPPLPNVPFNPYRASLYTAAQLYDAPVYAHTTDGRVYAWYTAQGTAPPLPAGLAMSLHDQAVGDALDDLLATLDARRIVGVMGGHDTKRDQDAYRLAAQLGAELAVRGFIVATGGGPGAMEAVNLGARLAGAPGDLEGALTRLATVPDFAPDITAWARVGLDVVASLPVAGVSLGIPTWFYGHEPPNVFATHVAKYFSNALREDVLLTRCRGGLIVLPGAAGTVQEIFQCATRNYYAPHDNLVTPMVLVGTDYWTKTLPAWPLLRALGDGRGMGRQVYLVDTVGEAVAAAEI